MSTSGSCLFELIALLWRLGQAEIGIDLSIIAGRKALHGFYVIANGLFRWI